MNRPTISPYLLYEDAAAALAWLAKAFGFHEVMRMADDAGVVNHGEMEYGNGSIMLGYPGADYRNPKRLGAWTDLTHVYVEDVEAHFEQAKAAGATILMEPTDQEYGDRRYDAEDPEGHRWSFGQPIQ